MATEKGIVTRTGETTAWVKTVQSSACKSCSARQSCTSASGGKEMEVEAINAANAREGDRIVLEFDTGSLLKATFLLYIFPVLCLTAGAVAGEQLAAGFHADGTLFSMLTGAFGFGCAFLFIKAKGNRLAHKNEYRPKIIRVLSHPS